jgi:hypothetical protein
MATHLDSVYMLVQYDKAIYYAPPGTNPSECWRNAAIWDAVEGGINPHAIEKPYVKGFMKSMKSVGWRAKKFLIFSDKD